MNKIPGGIWSIMLIPFTEEGKIDFKGFKARKKELNHLKILMSKMERQIEPIKLQE